jgi:uncharacterized repeat protein (TIGR01451 family)
MSFQRPSTGGKILHMATARRLRTIALGIGIAVMGAGERLGPSTVFADAAEAQPVSRGSEEKPQEKPSRVRSSADKLPLYFVENQGQVDARVAYYVPGLEKVIYFASDGVTLVLSGRLPQDRRRAGLEPTAIKSPSAAADGAPRVIQRQTVKLDFVGANRYVQPTGEALAPAVVSYFKGPQSAWKTGLKTYTRLVYADLWPGIDLIYSGTGSRLKYMFVVKPGVDPNLIKLAYRGASNVSLDGQGRIEVQTELGSFHDDKPTAYQQVRGVVMDVDVGYELRSEPDNDSHQYSFRLASYDSTLPLMIDPAIIVYAGFIGGSGDDRGNAIAVDSAGSAYITGETSSTETTFFPATVGPDLMHSGGVDAFVAKVSADGTALLYAGYIGGSGTDRGNGIAVDSSGNAYIVGETDSTAVTFPELVGPNLVQGGSVDAFVAKVNAGGTALLYAGFIGGSGDDRGKAIALEPGCVLNCSAYVTGETHSTEATFPDGNGIGLVPGPDLTHNGGVDAFVAKVSATGSGLIYAGYIGGDGDDRGNGIAVDSDGIAYITGETSSTEATFPDGNGFGAVAGFDQTHNGGVDAFVAKVNATGTALLYASYLGGSGDDKGNGIALQPGETGCPPDCSVYIVGETDSTEATFPEKIGPDLTYNGGVDAFVAKVKADGSGLDWAGYVGGDGDDRGNGIAVDSDGNAYITGETNSTQTTFPETVGPDQTYNGGVDAFVAKVKADASGLDYAGYIGGSGTDRGKGIALDTNTDVYIVGETNSSESTFPGKTGPDTTQNLAFDAFVAKLCNAVCADISVRQSDSPDPVAAGSTVTYTITVTNNGPDDATAVTVTDALPATTSLVAATPTSGTCSGTGPVVCDIGNLNNGEIAIVTIVVTTTPVAGTLVNNVSVLAAQTDPNPSNNTSTEHTVAALPNLVITALQAPKAVLPGTTFIIQDTTKNSGLIAAPATTTRFYLSTDKIVGAGDVVLGSRPVPALMPNESDPLFSTTVTILPATTLGRYSLIGVPDADDVVAETKNTDKTTRAITVTLPDLVVSQLRAPTSAAVGSTISVQETTSNKGLVDAGASATRFYLSSDSALDGGDVLLSARAVPALATKGKNTAFTNVTIPLGTAQGKYFLIAAADANGEVAETVETNNVRSRIITITP